MSLFTFTVFEGSNYIGSNYENVFNSKEIEFASFLILNIINFGSVEQLKALLPFLISSWSIDSIRPHLINAIKKLSESISDNEMCVFWIGRLFHRQSDLREMASNSLRKYFELFPNDKNELRDAFIPSTIDFASISISDKKLVYSKLDDRVFFLT